MVLLRLRGRPTNFIIKVNLAIAVWTRISLFASMESGKCNTLLTREGRQIVGSDLGLSLVFAHAVSGSYVKTGTSPQLKDVIKFLDDNK